MDGRLSGPGGAYRDSAAHLAALPPLSQLEEGYGIPVRRWRSWRAPCMAMIGGRFACRGRAARSAAHGPHAEAIAIIQFKLEGQLGKKHPEWHIEGAASSTASITKAGTVRLGDKTYPMLDRALPTIDPADPYKLSAEEEVCMARLKAVSSSPTLWGSTCALSSSAARCGCCAINTLIFHGCVPVDAAGQMLPFTIDGEQLRGKALFTLAESGSCTARVPPQGAGGWICSGTPVGRTPVAAFRQGPHGDLRDLLRRRQSDAP